MQTPSFRSHKPTSHSSAWGSSHTHSDSALSSAFASLVCCSPRRRRGHGRTHLHGHGCGHLVFGRGGCFCSVVRCCCLVRCLNLSLKSCPRTTRRWIRRLRGARGIYSTLVDISYYSPVVPCCSLNGQLGSICTVKHMSLRTFTALLSHALIVHYILCPLNMSPLLRLGA